MNVGWPLILLFLLGSKRGGGGGGAALPSPAPERPAPKPTDPFVFTPPQAQPVSNPVKSVPGTKGPRAPAGAWVPYDSGGQRMSAAIIARAQALLKDKTAHETIEPDPSKPGKMVRYLRQTDNPPGHTSVTAWRPRDGSGGAVNV